MWRVRQKPQRPVVLLSVPGALVFLVDRSTSPSEGARGRLREVGRDLQRRVRQGSPFHAHKEDWNSQQLIVAFEVAWESVVGFDWSRPLVHDGRVVLEARAVVKRIFHSVDDAKEFYDFAPSAIAAAAVMVVAAAAVTASADCDSAPASAASLPRVGHRQSFEDGDDMSVGMLSEGLTGNSPLPDWQPAASTRMSQGSAPGALMQPHSMQQAERQGQRSDAAPAAQETPAMDIPSPADGSCKGNRLRRPSFGRRSSQLSDLAASPSKVAVKTPQLTGSFANTRRLSNGSWPVPSHWTAVSQSFPYRTIAFTFREQRLHDILQPIIEGDERLLRLYETGLQTWAIYMPAYGIYYRPWLRTLAWNVFILVSAFSLASGFYDLYKHTPFLDKVLRGAFAGLHLTPLREWLDQHVKLRLSILLTYLFGNSIYAMQLLQWFMTMVRYARGLSQPVVDVIGPPLDAVRGVAIIFGSQVLGSIGIMLSPLVALMQMVWGIISGFLLPLKLAGASIRTVAVTLFGALRASQQLAAAGNGAGSQASWWYSVLPLDVLHVSGVKVFSSMARHRLTLGRRLRRRWALLQAQVQAQLRMWLAALQAWLLSVKEQWTPRKPAVTASVQASSQPMDPLAATCSGGGHHAADYQHLKSS